MIKASRSYSLFRLMIVPKLTAAGVVKMAPPISSTVGAFASAIAGGFHEEEILVEENNHTRTAILNRPRQLNALSRRMIDHLTDLYKMWETDDLVSLVMIKGSGRAFCAGGDVAESYAHGNAGQHYLSKDYFSQEYNTNYILGTYKKPHVAILDGIVMGGGAGISIHGSLRVATEKSVFSMPETELGLHPDVGASYFLSRLPGYFGEYAALTGARLDGPDLLACGLATHFVPSESLPELEKLLKSLTSGDVEDVSSVIDEFSIKLNPKEGSPLHRLAEINKCFSKTTVEKILEALEIEGDKCDGWYIATAERLRRASPVSLKITLRSIREGRHQSLRDCLIREYRMTIRCVMQKFSGDFYEGVRAILVDKDRSPKWNPATLELVTPDIVSHYFSPFEEDAEELQLCIRHDPQLEKVRGLSRL